jgi:hypothetical protein
MKVVAALVSALMVVSVLVIPANGDTVEHDLTKERGCLTCSMFAAYFCEYCFNLGIDWVFLFYNLITSGICGPIIRIVRRVFSGTGAVAGRGRSCTGTFVDVLEMPVEILIEVCRDIDCPRIGP